MAPKSVEVSLESCQQTILGTPGVFGKGAVSLNAEDSYPLTDVLAPGFILITASTRDMNLHGNKVNQLQPSHLLSHLYPSL
jgi:hypothetical protein